MAPGDAFKLCEELWNLQWFSETAFLESDLVCKSKCDIVLHKTKSLLACLTKIAMACGYIHT